MLACSNRKQKISFKKQSLLSDIRISSLVSSFEMVGVNRLTIYTLIFYVNVSFLVTSMHFDSVSTMFLWYLKLKKFHPIKLYCLALVCPDMQNLRANSSYFNLDSFLFKRKIPSLAYKFHYKAVMPRCRKFSYFF